MKTSVAVVEYEPLPKQGDTIRMNRDFFASKDVQLKCGKVMFASHSLISWWTLLPLISRHKSLAFLFSEIAMKLQIPEKV